MATYKEMMLESRVMMGVNGLWKKIIYVGLVETENGIKKLFQADHEWLYGKLNNMIKKR